ncbi:MAG: hypothetical protein ACFFAS_02260 [Promethearchaeota archaeon]
MSKNKILDGFKIAIYCFLTFVSITLTGIIFLMLPSVLSLSGSYSAVEYHLLLNEWSFWAIFLIICALISLVIFLVLRRYFK